jgi:hypothetical protein
MNLDRSKLQSIHSSPDFRQNKTNSDYICILKSVYPTNEADQSFANYQDIKYDTSD